MHFDWIIFAGSIALLLIPGSLLFPTAAKERLLGLHSSEFRIEKMLVTWQNWLDLLRALAGTYFLLNSPILIDAVEEHGVLIKGGIVGPVLIAAVVAQTLHRRRFFYLTAPVFFMWGITVVMAGLIPAIFAILFSTILTRLLNHVELKFPMLAVLAGGVGYLLNGFSPNLAMACAVIPIPLILAYVSMDTLLCFSRDLAAE